MNILWGILIPLIGTTAGSACVFLLKNKIKPEIQKILLGFAFLLILDRCIPHLHLGSDTPEGPERGISKTVMLVLAVTLHNIPEGYEVPEGRVKPWGTAHAVYSCMDEIDGPFAVINADDYYGVEAFKLIYDYLSTHADDDKYRYTMVGYHLANTVTDNGYVSRGVCETNENGELVSVTERTRIEKYNGGVAYTEDDGNTWVQVPDDTTVSMNMWGFTKSILEEIKAGFPAFLDKGLQENPMKCEYFLPTVVSNLLAEDKATVSVLKSADKWYGVTYKEDKPVVVAAIQRMKDEGLYPQHLWEGK